MLTADEHDYVREQIYIRIGGVGSVRATLAGAMPLRLRIRLPDALLPEGLVAEAIQICLTDGNTDTPRRCVSSCARCFRWTAASG